MTERKYYCLNCECKMQCIMVNLHSDMEICLKDKNVNINDTFDIITTEDGQYKEYKIIKKE